MIAFIFEIITVREIGDKHYLVGESDMVGHADLDNHTLIDYSKMEVVNIKII